MEEQLLSSGELKTLYTYAYSLYQQKYYLKAEQYFHFLILSAPESVKYWKGLAAAQQMQLKYEEAVNSYSCAALLDKQEQDAAPHIYAAQCLLALKEYSRAHQALQSAEMIAEKGFTPEYIKINIQKIKNHLQGCKNA